MIVGYQTYDIAPWIQELSAEAALKLILQELLGTTPPGTGGGGSGGIPVIPSSQPVTENPVSLGASGSQAIPVGAVSWAAVLLTGTGTINGVAMPLGVPLSGGTLAATVTIATGSTSTAFVLYETA